MAMENYTLCNDCNMKKENSSNKNNNKSTLRTAIEYAIEKL